MNSLRPICSDWNESGVVDALRRVSTSYCAVLVEECLIAGTLDEATWLSKSPNRKRDLALRRVDYGDRLEQHAAQMYAALSNRENASIALKACQLYFDAYACATWTSAHAEYVAACDSGIVEPPEPSIGLFPCASSDLDLADLFSRRLSTKADGAYPKATESLVQLIARATNPGARG